VNGREGASTARFGGISRAPILIVLALFALSLSGFASVPESSAAGPPGARERGTEASLGDGAIRPPARRAAPRQSLEAASPTASASADARIVHLYYVWYGQWNDPRAVSVLEDLAREIGSSSYLASARRRDAGPAAKVTYEGSARDPYSQGTVLSRASVQRIVLRAIATGALPADSDGLYLVLGSSDVDENGFCSVHCGWHAQGLALPPSMLRVHYGFAGDPAARCPQVCGGATVLGGSPNDAFGADAMVSAIVHPIEAMLAGSTGHAHRDLPLETPVAESADRRTWDFRAAYVSPNGALANTHIGHRDYFIRYPVKATTSLVFY